MTSDGGLATVRFHYSVGASTLPIEIADRKGFFEKHGINFVGTKVTPGPGLIPSLGRQSDILQTSVQAVLEAVNKGLDLKLVSGMGNSTKAVPAFPVFTNNEEIKSYADFTGKTVGVPSLNGFPTTAISYLAGEQGGDPSKVEFVVVPWDTQADQLKAGRVDGVWTIVPHAWNLRDLGFRNMGDPTLIATNSDELLASVTVTTAEFAEENPEVLKAIKAALAEATEWMKANEQEAKEILVEWANIPPQFVLDEPLTDIKIDISASDLQPILDLYKKTGVLTNLPPAEQLFVPNM